MPDSVPAVPAQPADTPVLSAAHQAVADNDFATFESSRFATASGKPASAPAPVKAETPAEKPAAAAPAQPVEEPAKVSARQQKINDYERRIAEQNERIARLEADRRPAPAAPRSEPTNQPITLAQTIAQPDIRTAPIAEAQFYELHPDAGTGDYADYRAAYRYAYNDAARAQQSEQQSVQRAEQERVSKAKASMDAAVAADPAFVEKVTPILSSLQTREQARLAGIAPEAVHDFASALVRSEVAAKLLNHLAEHPEVLDKVRALESHRDVLTFFGRLEARFLDTDTASAAPPPAPIPRKTVSDAPPPPPTLGSRPATTADPLRGAVERDDYKGYEASRFAGHQPGR